MKRIKATILILALALFLASSALIYLFINFDSNINVEKKNTDYINEMMEIDNLKAENKNYKAETEKLKEQNSYYDTERKAFREDIKNLTDLLNDKNSLGLELPVFRNFEQDKISSEHIKIIKNYLMEYEEKVKTDPGIYQDIEPILCFLEVQPKEN